MTRLIALEDIAGYDDDGDGLITVAKKGQDFVITDAEMVKAYLDLGLAKRC